MIFLYYTILILIYDVLSFSDYIIVNLTKLKFYRGRGPNNPNTL